MKSFLESYKDFSKSNPFNFTTPPAQDPDELFKTEEPDASIPDIQEQNVESVTKGLSDDDIARIAAKMIELQKTASVSVQEGGNSSGNVGNPD